MPSAKDLLTKQEQEQVVSSIQQAEQGTSGEIRLHIEETTQKDPLLRAEEVFLRLGMEKTKDRTGVLIYVAVKDHKLAIIGDKGIHEVVGIDFWEAEKQLLIEHFSKSDYTGGLVKAIGIIGERLKRSFQIKPEDENEMSNEISFK